MSKGGKSFKSERKVSERGEKIEFPPRRRRKILLRLNRISFREGRWKIADEIRDKLEIISFFFFFIETARNTGKRIDNTNWWKIKKIEKPSSF